MKNNEVNEKSLTCGERYYVEIPIDIFDIPGVDKQNANTFMLRSTTVLHKVGSLTGVVTDKVVQQQGHTTVEFIHVELFPLD